MIYAVQILIRQSVANGTPYVFTLEDQIDVQAVMGASFRFYNPTAGANPSADFKLQVTVAQSGLFSDTYTLLDSNVPKGTTVAHVFDQPIVKGSLTTHTLTYTNNDTGGDRTLYGILSGWSDVKTVLSNYIGAAS
jgi:hypothetical protein